MKVELLFAPDCPNVEPTRARLREVLAARGLPAVWDEVDLTAPAGAHGAAYGSPTVLVNGEDVTGQPPSGGSCCRLYSCESGSSGVPGAELIAAALVRARRTRWLPAWAGGLSLATLGAAVAAVSCPGCWPAYLAVAVSVLTSLAAGPLGWIAVILVSVSAAALLRLAYRRRTCGDGSCSPGPNTSKEFKMKERALIVLSIAGLFLGAFAAHTQGVPRPAGSAAAAGCATGSSCDATPVTLTPAEEKAAAWAVSQILKAGSVERALAGDKPKSFLKRGGFDLARLDLERVKAGVDAKLSLSGSELSVTRCAAYGACAIGVDLTEATGPLLEKYKKQKSEDGQTFTGRSAPAFQLKDLDGRTVSLSDFKGRRVALVFWQSHCSHSQQSLPIWNTLRKELGGKDFEVVTVLFHGGEAPYVKKWYDPMGLKLPVLLAENDALAEAYGSHLVPSVFLVDENGRLVKKLVTQQTADTLRKELTGFAKRGA